jgi:hypothetical protein
LNKHKAQAHRKNRDRAETFVRDLKTRGLLFLRVDIDAGEGYLAHEGSARGRREIEMLRKTGVISNMRHAKFYGPAHVDGVSLNTYVAVPRDKIRDLGRLEDHGRAFDQAARLDLALRRFEETPVVVTGTDTHMAQRMNYAFAYAARGVNDAEERESLRAQFEQAVSLMRQQHRQVPQFTHRPAFQPRYKPV